MSDSLAPARPDGVPAESVWRGGLDGGSFLVLRADEAFAALYHVSVFHDFTGDVLSDGLYAVRWPGAPQVRTGRPDELIAEFDGEDLVLRDGRRLGRVPGTPIRTYLDEQ